MKRVGILTFYYKVKNYGAMLQSYALYLTIKRLGYECKQISYDRFSHSKSTFQQIRECLFDKKFFKLFQKGLIILKRKIQSYSTSKLNIRNRLFDQFMISIPHTIRYTDENIEKCIDQFDILVCGSDQIWNPNWSNDIFFLEFTESVDKIAYAASIGQSVVTDDYKKILVNIIKKFNAVSLRENQLIEELSILSDRNIECVLDPTMLLEKEDYEKLCSAPIIDDSYTLVYLLGGNKKNVKTARRISKLMGRKVAYIPYVGDYGFYDEKYSNYPLLDIGPKEFLCLIKNADAIITDSFHACVFSIIFHKNFYCLERKEVLTKSNMGSRLITLLNDFSLQERLINSYDDYLNLDPIDYALVDIRLKELKKGSLEFLRQALEGGRKIYEKKGKA